MALGLTVFGLAAVVEFLWEKGRYLVSHGLERV
jgi:hypothetical protein